MGRYIGPKYKICRRYRENIFSCNNDKEYKFNKKSNNIYNIKSPYGKRLFEKQKIKFIYGILEKQFRNMYIKASKKKGNTGEILLQNCECRLDNIIYRLGFTVSRSFARQMIVHKHIYVNNSIVNIPSFILKENDIISINKKFINNKYFINMLNNLNNKKQFNWLIRNNKDLYGIIKYIPTIKEIPENIDIRLVIEFYSK